MQEALRGETLVKVRPVYSVPGPSPSNAPKRPVKTRTSLRMHPGRYANVAVHAGRDSRNEICMALI